MSATDFDFTSAILGGPYIYQFHVELIGASPRIWRRIQVPHDYTFRALHMAIQDAMGWDDCQPYRFYSFSILPSMILGPPFEGVPHSYLDDALIQNFFNRMNAYSLYKYDFECKWVHGIVLENIWPAQPGVNYPVCVGGERGCPPEGIGGLQHYEAHLSILADPTNPFHQLCMAWQNSAGGVAATEQFNPDSVVFRSAF